MTTVIDESSRGSYSAQRRGESVERPSRARRNFDLIVEFALTAFKLKYAGSVLGYVWTLVKPLLVFGTMYVVFALFLLRGRTSAAENFPVQLLVGVVIWSFFAEATMTALTSIASNSDLILKAFFTRWVLVVASTLSAAMTLLVNICLVLAIGLPLHWFHIGWATLFLPLLLIELYAFALGIGLMLAALFVYYRDLGHIWEIVLQVLFYASAIVFPFSLIPGGLKVLVALNPIAQIVEDLRRCLVSDAVPWSTDILGGLVVVPLACAGVALVAGGYAFRRLSRNFGVAL